MITLDTGTRKGEGRSHRQRQGAGSRGNANRSAGGEVRPRHTPGGNRPEIFHATAWPVSFFFSNTRIADTGVANAIKAERGGEH